MKVVEELLPRISSLLVVEMNTGQMLEDVRLTVQGRVPVEFYGRLGGVVPFPGEILREIERVAAKKGAADADPRRSWYDRITAAV
jgi:2-oxoglutarate ferredoxin oxidoreductase subunit alpha